MTERTVWDRGLSQLNSHFLGLLTQTDLQGRAQSMICNVVLFESNA